MDQAWIGCAGWMRRLSCAAEVWAIFDNTATRAAADNARSLMGRLYRAS